MPPDDMHDIEMDEEMLALLQKVAAEAGMTPDEVMAQALGEWVAQADPPA